jgi:hypothetical protein
VSIERLYDLVDQERRDAAEFRESMRTELGAIRGDLKALEARHDSHKLVVKALAWCACFTVSLIAIAAAVSCQ